MIADNTKDKVAKMEQATASGWMCTGILWSLFFGYVALGYSEDPKHCIASDEFDKRVEFKGDWTVMPAMDGKYTDAGERFFTIFTVAFYASIVCLCGGILHTICHTKFIRLPVRSVTVLASFCVTGCVLASIVCRFIHSGRVCSGDFLDENESTEGYLTTSGFMIACVTFLYIGIFGLAFCGIIVALFVGTS